MKDPGFRLVVVTHTGKRSWKENGASSWRGLWCNFKTEAWMDFICCFQSNNHSLFFFYYCLIHSMVVEGFACQLTYIVQPLIVAHFCTTFLTSWISVLQISVAKFSIVTKKFALYMELQVALRLVPESKTFVNILKTEDENYDTLKENMQMLVSLFVPFLEDMHCILVSFISCFQA